MIIPDTKDSISSNPLIDYVDFLIEDGIDRCGSKESYNESDVFVFLQKYSQINKWEKWCKSFLELIFKRDHDLYKDFSGIGKKRIRYTRSVRDCNAILEAAKSIIQKDFPTIIQSASNNIHSQSNINFKSTVNLDTLNSLISEGQELTEQASIFDWELGHLFFGVFEGSNVTVRRWFTTCNYFLSKLREINPEYHSEFNRGTDIADVYRIDDAIEGLTEINDELLKLNSSYSNKLQTLITKGKAIFPRKTEAPYNRSGFYLNKNRRLDFGRAYIKRKDISKEKWQHFEEWISEIRESFNSALQEYEESDYDDRGVRPLSPLEDCLSDIISILDWDFPSCFKNMFCIDSAVNVLKSIKNDYLWERLIKHLKEPSQSGPKLSKIPKEANASTSKRDMTNPASPFPLEIDQENGQATYNGKAYSITPDQARILQKLIDANGEFIPLQSLKVDPKSSERPDRILSRLPKPLRDFVEKKPGAGTRIKVPSLE